MAGKFASLIVVASVFITGFVGYLANADVETDEREVYDYSANLVPSVLSSDVKQYEVYNPSGNVTGWYNDQTSNSVVQTTSTVSPYTLTSRITSYETHQIWVNYQEYFTDPNYSDWILPDNDSWLYGEVSVRTGYLDQNNNYNTGYVFFRYDPTASQNERLMAYLVSQDGDETSVIEGGYFVGGRTMSKHFVLPNVRSDFLLDTKITNPVGGEIFSSDANNALFVIPLQMIANHQGYTFHTGDVIDLSGVYVFTSNAEDIGWLLVGGRESTSSANFHYTWGMRNAYQVYEQSQTGVGFVYNEDVHGWFRAKNMGGFWFQDDTDTALYTLDKLAIAVINPTLTYGPYPTINWEKATITNATYADNTKMVEIGTRSSPPFSTEGIWSNGNSNGSITFLAKLTSATGNLYIDTYDKDNNLNGSFLATPGDVVSPTGYVQIILDVIGGTARISPVNTFANTLNYTTSGYSKNLAVSQAFDGTDISSLHLRYTNTGEAYIESTTVQLDPNGLLWSNPSMYLQYYYPDAFNGINTMKMPRVWFNSFVSLGTSITINGITYPVQDGTIDVQGTTVALKGLAVDWRDEDGIIHVFIVPNGDVGKSIDVGALNTATETAHIKSGGAYVDAQTTVGYNIKAEGVWYFEFGLYNGYTEQYDKINLNLVKGWGLSFQGACLLFAGSVILCTAIAGYYGRDRTDFGMEFMDWVIIILVLIVTIVLAGMM